MASKRTRSGKAPMSEDPIFPYLQGDFLWFKSKRELHKFTTSFENREILPLRFLPPNFCSSKGYDHVHNALLKGNWYNFLGHPLSFIHEPLIRAFYSNFRKVDDDVYITNINGKEIILTSETIHQITSLGNPQEFNPEPYDEVDFLQTTGVTREDITGNNRPTIANMLPQYRLLLYLLTYIIAPRKHSHSTITHDDARVMFCILNNSPNFNWCKLILAHMTNALQSKYLPYGHLIMAILLHFGIDTSVGPKTKATKLWEICDSTFKKGKISAPPKRAKKKSSSPTNLNTVMDAIHHLSREMQIRFDLLDHRLDNYFKHVNYQEQPIIEDEGDEEEGNEDQNSDSE